MSKRWWEKKNQEGKLYLSLAIILSTIMFVVGTSWIAWAAVQQENGIYGWYSAGSKWVKIGTTSTGGINTNVAGDKTAADNYTNPTDAVPALTFNMGYDGSTWDRIYSHPMDNNALTYNKTGLVTASGLYGRSGTGATNNWSPMLDYNGGVAGLASGTAGALMVAPYGRDVTNGGVDPVNILPTLADGITVFGATEVLSALYGYNGSTYDRIGSGSLAADNITAYTTGNLRNMSFLFGYDGTNWDRAKIDTNGSLYVNPGALADTTDAVVANTTSNATSAITTNATTAVKATGGKMMKVITRADNPGATSTIRFYDIATAGCTGTPASGDTALLLDTTTDNTIYDINHQFTNGICAVTAGGTAAYVTVTYR